jgi:hypothetical protein
MICEGQPMQINTASLIAAQQARMPAQPQKPAQFQPMEFAQKADAKLGLPAQPNAQAAIALPGSLIDIRV